MGYCSVSDIKNDFKSFVFNGTSIVTDTAVTGFITEAGALIDANVGQRYVAPVTGDPSSLALMSLFCRTLVSERVRGILSNKQAVSIDANAVARGYEGLTSKDVLKSLNDIKNGALNLSGASLLNSSASFYSNNVQNNVTPRFRKNTRAW